MIIKKYETDTLCELDLIKEGYTRVKELENKVFFLISNTLMVLIFIIGLYNILGSNEKDLIFIYSLITILCIIPHEILHGLFFEGGLKSKNTILNFNLKKGLICCNYNGGIEKYRMLISLVSPLIILTVIPSIIYWFGITNVIIKSFIIINLALSVGDILGMLYTIMYIPKNSIIVSKCYRNYYKEEHDNFIIKQEKTM